MLWRPALVTVRGRFDDPAAGMCGRGPCALATDGWDAGRGLVARVRSGDVATPAGRSGRGEVVVVLEAGGAAVVVFAAGAAAVAVLAAGGAPVAPCVGVPAWRCVVVVVGAGCAGAVALLAGVVLPLAVVAGACAFVT